MELRWQRHDDGVDIIPRKQVVGRDRQAILFAGKAFGTGKIEVRDRVKCAQPFQRPDMVAAPVPAPEDCNTRFHQIGTQAFRAKIVD